MIQPQLWRQRTLKKWKSN